MINKLAPEAAASKINREISIGLIFGHDGDKKRQFNQFGGEKQYCGFLRIYMKLGLE